MDGREESLGMDRRIGELASDLLTVQQQVGQLELAAQEKRKPWWLQASFVISVLSLTLSVAFSLYTALDQAHQRKLEAAKEMAAGLDHVLSDIIAIRMEDSKQAVTLASSNLAAYQAWTVTAMIKRAMLIDSALDQVGKLQGDLAPTSALTLGNELIVDGRYEDAAKLLNAGLVAAEHAKTSPVALLSALAQVYLYPGHRLSDPDKGRKVYWQAINSYPSQADYNILSNRLTLILGWAVNEQGFGNQAASAKLLKLADDVVRECLLPEAAKAQLQATLDGVRTQMSLRASGPSLFAYQKLAGKWSVVESDSQSSELIILPGTSSSFPNFTRDRLFSGRLVERISGVVVILGKISMRLDWGSAWDSGPSGPFPKTGYSEVILRPDGSLQGTDFALGLLPRKWTARISVANGRK
jgi:hypothetical protein